MYRILAGMAEMAGTVEPCSQGGKVSSEARESKSSTQAFFKLLLVPHLITSRWIKHVLAEPESLWKGKRQGCGSWECDWGPFLPHYSIDSS